MVSYNTVSYPTLEEKTKVMIQVSPLQERPSRPGATRVSLAYLRAIDIFQDLSVDELESIHRIAPMRWCSRGTVFYRPGVPGERLFLLKEGMVTLYRLSPDGRKLVVSMVRKGTVFGEMTLAGQSMQECFAEAHEDSLVCSITLPQMERILKQHPPVAQRLLQGLGNRVRMLEERLEQMAYGNVRQRLARFLLNQARHTKDGCQVEGFTHELIGEAVGTSRQTVSLELGTLEKDGLVETGRRRIRLLNILALKSVAGLFEPWESRGVDPDLSC